MAAGPFEVAVGLYLDGLSLVMVGVITGVGFLIHLYAPATWPTKTATAAFSPT